ncbi:MAG TPA: hypothetical protein VFC62_02335 [Atopostipes sp.]|nr:hypothetical protein [Atopostipes sp.]
MAKKEKGDLRKNPDVIDTSMGKKYLEEGRVVMLENRFYDNSEKNSNEYEYEK